METVKFRVTEITRYLTHDGGVRAKVLLAVAHGSQKPPFPVSGQIDLDLEEGGHFDVGDTVGIAFEFE